MQKKRKKTKISGAAFLEATISLPILVLVILITMDFARGMFMYFDLSIPTYESVRMASSTRSLEQNTEEVPAYTSLVTLPHPKYNNSGQEEDNRPNIELITPEFKRYHRELHERIYRLLQDNYDLYGHQITVQTQMTGQLGLVTVTLSTEVPSSIVAVANVFGNKNLVVGRSYSMTYAES